MNLELKGRAALVNGASSGIGEAVARALAAEGVNLILCARNGEKLAAKAAAIAAEFGVQAVPHAADVAAEDAAAGAVGEALARFGRLDILLNNGGGPPAGRFDTLNESQWKDAADLLLMSAVRFTRAALPAMKAAHWGRILNVSSVSVKAPIDNLMLSNSLRAAVIGFAKTLSTEVAPYGITVNNLLPGRIHTPRLDYLAEQNAKNGGTAQQVFEGWVSEIPMGRLGEPQEVGALAAFLASPLAGYLTGQSIAVDGGLLRNLY